MASQVDAGALVTALHADAARALADAVTFAVEWNREHGRALDEAQEAELAYAAILASARLEARFTVAVVDALEAGGVTPYGFGASI
jgi:hypothetical protein